MLVKVVQPSTCRFCVVGVKVDERLRAVDQAIELLQSDLQAGLLLLCSIVLGEESSAAQDVKRGYNIPSVKFCRCRFSYLELFKWCFKLKYLSRPASGHFVKGAATMYLNGRPFWVFGISRGPNDLATFREKTFREAAFRPFKLIAKACRSRSPSIFRTKLLTIY